MSIPQYPEIKTLANLEAGDKETARTFEAAADQEVMHAFGRLDLLYPPRPA